MAVEDDATWVQLWEPGKYPYYWNRRTKAATRKYVESSWVGRLDSETGRFFYWRRHGTEPVVWELPNLEQGVASCQDAFMPSWEPDQEPDQEPGQESHQKPDQEPDEEAGAAVRAEQILQLADKFVVDGRLSMLELTCIKT